MAQINWAEQDENTGITIYPAAMYEVKIKAVDMGVASTGNPQAKFSAEIAAGRYTGKRITEFCVLTEKALWRVAKLVKACGIDIKKLGIMDLGSQAFKNVLNMCVGKHVNWLVEEKSYNGRPQNEILDYLPVATVDDDPTVLLNDLPAFLNEQAPGPEGV
jgi:hypothetical protein